MECDPAFLSKQEEVDMTMEVFDELNEKFSKTCKVCLECLAYAGTGNVHAEIDPGGILDMHCVTVTAVHSVQRYCEDS